MESETHSKDSSNRTLGYLCLVVCLFASYMFLQTVKLDSAIHPSSIWPQTPRLQFALTSGRVLEVLNEWAKVNPEFPERARVALDFDNKNVASYGLSLLLVMFWFRRRYRRLKAKFLALPVLAMSADFAENALLYQLIFQNQTQRYIPQVLFALATIKVLALLASACAIFASFRQPLQRP